MSDAALKCFVCHMKTEDWRNELRGLRSQHSSTYVTDFIKKILCQYDTKRDIDDVTNCICADCLNRFEEYDWTCTMAKQYETELYDLLVRAEELCCSEEKGERSNSNLPIDPSIDPPFSDPFNESAKQTICNDKVDTENDVENCNDAVQNIDDYPDFNCKLSVLTNRRPNKGSNTNRSEALELMDDGRIEGEFKSSPISCKLSKKNESMNSFDFDKDNYAGGVNDEEDSDDGIDINIYIADCKKPEPTFMCTICKVDFKKEDQLNEHSKLHNGKPLSHCVYCKRIFQKRKYLKPHIEMHYKKMFGIEEFLCDFCGRTFLYRANLFMHLITHNKERKFKCDICGMGFKTKQHVARHLISHSKTKSNTCDICGHKFAHKANLTIHRRQHNGEFEKTHDCSYCGASFPRKFKLKEHLEKNHGTFTLLDGSVGPCSNQ